MEYKGFNYLDQPRNDVIGRSLDWLADHPACTHCGLRDAADVGDWSCMVAACSHCSVLACGDCWDAHHADTCSQD